MAGPLLLWRAVEAKIWGATSAPRPGVASLGALHADSAGPRRAPVPEARLFPGLAGDPGTQGWVCSFSRFIHSFNTYLPDAAHALGAVLGPRVPWRPREAYPARRGRQKKKVNATNNRATYFGRVFKGGLFL